VTGNWGVFRPAAAPTTALPFGVRSVGHHHVEAPGVVDDRPPRPFTQLYWVAAGQVGFRVGAEEALCGPGEIFVYAFEVPHRIRTLVAHSDYFWLTVDGILGGACVDAFGLQAPWPRQAGPVPERFFDRLAGLLADPSTASERIAATLGWELLSAAATPGGVAAPTDDAVERLRRQLVDRAGDPDLSVAALAGELGLDRSVLTRRFTRATGMAPKPFLQSIRLSRAMSLLHATDAPIATIAHECGFADAGYFSRAFRLHTGQSPERFRKA
jgi:AraC-like DNA-binding protein